MALETFEDPAELYLARGDEVSSDRPLFTGDVFASVRMLGFEGRRGVVIVAHPCTFRRGAALQDTVLVSPLERRESAIGRSAWSTGYYDLAPFPDAEADGVLSVARLDLMGRAAVADLLVTQRVACMSEYGINLLQQRLTFHLTRAEIPTSRFDDAFSHYLEEADSLEEWIGTLREGGFTVEEATERFESFIRAGAPSRQERMRERQFRAAVRAQCRQEAARIVDEEAG